MLWLKFLLGGLSIAFCTLLGYLAADKYRRRKGFYLSLQSLNEKYLAELKFSRKPLGEFLKACEFRGDFQAFLEEFQKTRTAEPNLSYLSKGEKEEIKELFSMLGRGDATSQLGYFSAQAETLKKKCEETGKEAKERSELYLKLGLLAGLAFVILIV